MIREVREKEFPTIIDVQGNEMIKEIDKARKDKDSVGGIIEMYRYQCSSRYRLAYL